MDKVLEQIIQDSVGLIWEIAKKFYGVEKSDLYQAGVLGVIKAYQNYHNDGTTKFSTYAYKYIYGEMYMVANSKSIKVSKDVIKFNQMIERGRNMLAQKIMRMPSNKELADYLEIPLEKLEQGILYAKTVLSIDNDTEEERSLHEVVAMPESISELDRLLLSDSISTLNLLEQDIIESRYYEDLTQSETAKKLGITQVMVSRYETKSLAKMRKYMYM